jgi:hypothetical protein
VVKPMNHAVIMATTIPIMKFACLRYCCVYWGLMGGWLIPACEPTHSVRLHGVHGEIKFFGSVAGGALKRALLKAALSG